ncbi:fimbria/pilus outer membrane usher protein [Pseudomonas sp. HY7a-MNA-CIBAN-0227]|uniref:fimbria/pilus outer membrane usher protein n=1 Tax=Pseudomonas sp. HY7a-MNA-CIBAN-0227 TaxID=3140474 RepID=UPI00332E32FF
MLRSPSPPLKSSGKAAGYLVIMGSGLLMSEVDAAYRFDASFLEIGGGQGSAQVIQQVDAMSSGQLPGTYRVDVIVNEKLIDRRDLQFIKETVAQPSATGLFPCFDLAFLQGQGIKAERLSTAEYTKNGCVLFTGPIADISYRYDFNRQRLSLEIPQAYIGPLPFAVRRQQWSNGEQVAFTNYSFSGSTSQYRGLQQNNQFASLRSGFNTGPWRLRNYSTWHKSTAAPGKWQSLESYAQRDMGNWMAIATVGETSTEGDLFESIPYRGAEIASDLDMLPEQSRGFAPVIRGIATGRSLVTIRQRGYVINEQWVPSGPFALTNLYSTAGNGDLEVTVEGPSGQRQQFIQSFSSVPYMLRESQQSYSIAVGQYRPSDEDAETAKPALVQATLRRGLSGGSTVFGGTQISENYTSGLLGLAHDFAGVGAISLDVTHAQSDNIGGAKEHLSGQSYRFRYSKSLSATNTNFSLVGYRYSTKGFYTFTEALDSQVNSRWYDSAQYGHTKSSFNASVSQQFGTMGGLYANLSKSDYWNASQSNTSIQVGYNFSIGRVAYSLGVAQSVSQDATSRSLSLSLSLPLGAPESGKRVSVSTTQGSQGTAVRSTALSGSTYENNALSYSVGVTQHVSRDDNVTGGSLAARYNAANTIVHSAINQSADTRQLEYGIEGGVVAYKNNLMFTQPLGETNVIVATPGAAEVAVLNKSGIRTNGVGYTVVPSAQPYRKNRIALDTASLSDDTDISKLVQEITPNRGAFALAKFDTRIGRRVLLTVLDPSGQPAPFAADVQLFGGDGERLISAMMADNGRVYLTGVPPRSELVLKVNNNIWCAQALELPSTDQGEASIVQITIKCTVKSNDMTIGKGVRHDE